MQAPFFWKQVTMDTTDFLPRIAQLLESEAIRFAVIGGQAVNAYVDPLVSLDLDLAVAADQVARLEVLLGKDFKVERYPHSLNVSAAGSALRVQIQTDPRYSDFVQRASRRTVLGVTLPVGDVRDVLQGKVWAAQDPERRPSKRLKDLADIARLVEGYPELRLSVPADIQSRLT